MNAISAKARESISLSQSLYPDKDQYLPELNVPEVVQETRRADGRTGCNIREHKRIL